MNTFKHILLGIVVVTVFASCSDKQLLNFAACCIEAMPLDGLIPKDSTAFTPAQPQVDQGIPAGATMTFDDGDDATEAGRQDPVVRPDSTSARL